jgi:hypothetical protein
VRYRRRMVRRLKREEEFENGRGSKKSK